jgi:hypothetical protein
VITPELAWIGVVFKLTVLAVLLVFLWYVNARRSR